MTTQKPVSSGSSVSARTVTTPAGHQVSYNSSGHLSAMTTNRGTTASFNARGQVSTIHTANGATITDGPGGVRTIHSEHISPNGARYQVVSTGAHAGYVQHTYTRGGQTFVRRTYVSPGRTHVAVYQTRYYGGRAYYAYVPAYYYGPGFYGWAYNPWYAPAYYAWGWYDDPWYAPYGYYFSPYSVYPSAAYWLTDYVVSESLRAAFESRPSVNAEVSEETIGYQPEAQTSEVAMTPQIKQMIADEVKAELAAERSEAQNTSFDAIPAPQQATNNAALPPALNPNTRAFIVATSMEVSVNGESCALSPGDVLNRTEDTPDGSNTVAVTVVSSQKSDCRMGSAPRLQVANLQEMHNRFREKMDRGLNTLANNQGKGGIPSGPKADLLANPNGTADVELNARAEIESQGADADQAEKEVMDAQTSAASTSGGSK